MTKKIRGPHWTIPLIIDVLTSIFSKLDLYTDLTFLWVSYRCGIYFYEALVTMIIGVGFFQIGVILAILGWYECMKLSEWGDLGISWTTVPHAAKGADMMLLTKWFSALEKIQSEQILVPEDPFFEVIQA